MREGMLDSMRESMNDMRESLSMSRTAGQQGRQTAPKASRRTNEVTQGEIQPKRRSQKGRDRVLVGDVVLAIGLLHRKQSTTTPNCFGSTANLTSRTFFATKTRPRFFFFNGGVGGAASGARALPACLFCARQALSPRADRCKGPQPYRGGGARSQGAHLPSATRRPHAATTPSTYAHARMQ